MASVYLKRNTWYVSLLDGLVRRRLVRTLATTKGEARRLALELDRTAERQRLGLEAAPLESSATVADLCDWWLANRCTPGREYLERKRLQRHVLKAPFGKIAARHLTADDVRDALRAMLASGLSPWTVKGIRGSLNTVFRRAPKSLWNGPNPIQDVEPVTLPRKIRATLRAEEVPLLMMHVPDEWRGVFAAALYTGMRKGELFGLRKADVDLEHRLLVLARSYGAETTKGKHADVIPISAPLLPFLKAAIAESTSDLVFPNPDGSMRSPESDPQKVLRHALGRAGLVDGYEHVCRRCKAKGKPHSERHADAELRKCPQCGMKLWPRAELRQMRFHDLRHSTATLLLRAGVDLHRVQRILRHKDVKLTTDTYGHLDVEDLRAAVESMPSSHFVDAEFSTSDDVTGEKARSHATRLLPDLISEKNESPGLVDFSSETGALKLSGRQDLNLRPLGPEPSALPG